MTGNAANGAWFSGRLGLVNLAHDDKLGCAEPMLVSVLESGTKNLAQLQEGSGKSFYLLVYCWLFLLIICCF